MDKKNLDDVLKVKLFLSGGTFLTCKPLFNNPKKLVDIIFYSFRSKAVGSDEELF